MPSQTIPLARFLVLVCQRAGQIDDVTYRDPFGAARNFISASADNAEARMLSRLWDAIYLREGEFKESEIYLLGPQALVIAAAVSEASTQQVGPMFFHAYCTEAIDAYFDKKHEET